MKKGSSGYLTLAGFLLFLIGFSALVLMIVGVQFAFLTWIDAGGRLLGLLIRILMIIAGVVLVVYDRTDWEGNT